MPAITIPAQRSNVTDLQGSRANVAWWQFWGSMANRLNKRAFTASEAAESHTGNTADTLLATIPVQGFAYGIARLTMMFSCTNNANAKTVTVKLGSTSVQTIDLDTSTATQSAVIVISGRGAQVQYTDIMSAINCAGSGGIASTVSISSNSKLAVYGQLSVNTDTIALESWALEVEQI